MTFLLSALARCFMKKISQRSIYLECYGGISGDMVVAALLDAGADEKELKKQLATLPLEGFAVEVGRVKKSALDCCNFNVVLEAGYHNHDHDMEYLYGHKNTCGHTHDGEHMPHEHVHGGEHMEHDHTHSGGHMAHEHIHSGEHMAHDHVHRGLRDVLDIINRSEITDGAKKIAADIFQVLAQAEAKAHGATVETVHFHEVGAVDSIVDIAAAAICFDNLGISDVIIPELYEGKGTIRCAHGILPVPVPAVMHIAEEHGLKLHITDAEAELVTPTGAAIAAAMRTKEKLPEQFTILSSGAGAGKRDYGFTNILRAMIIESEENSQDEEKLEDIAIVKLESNIDDCTGEVLGYAMERLFEAGARDVNYMPVFMKKNRPAYQVNVICAREDVPTMEEILFKETTTIGIRRIPVERTVLKRECRTVRTTLGDLKAKVCDIYGESRLYPEYESVAAIAREKKMPYREVWEQVLKELAGNGGI